MEFIQIPVPDFSFEIVAKEKAKEISYLLLHQHAIWQYGMGANRGLEDRLSIAIGKIVGKEEKLVCIKELINHVYGVKVSFNTTHVGTETEQFFSGVNHILYYLYALAKSETGYTFDRNAFTDNEVRDINAKLDAIIDALNKVQLGQDIIYNDFDTIKEQIKSDFENLRYDLVLGKKPFYKMALGTIGSFLGNKTADAVFDQIKPVIIAFFMNEAPHLVEHVQKLLNQIAS